MSFCFFDVSDPRPLPPRLAPDPNFDLTIGFEVPEAGFSLVVYLDLTPDPPECYEAPPPCGDPPGLLLLFGFS